jgi:hypothetical protein
MAGPSPRGEDADFPEPPRLRALRRMVMALTGTLIVGVITVVALLVIRLAALAPPPTPPTPPALPEAVVLPAGESARAVTFGTGWIAVVTVDDVGRERIRVLDAATGAGLAETLIPRR